MDRTNRWIPSRTREAAAGWPVPRAWGWATPGGGRAANVEGGTAYQATSTQLCGLFPFAVASGAIVRGVPVGRHMLTAEPIGFDPAEWLHDGLVTNTNVWVQGQPGVGKSTFIKRCLTGLVAFGWTGVIPGDLKGEYTPVVHALAGTVWRIGRGLHALNPLDAGPLRDAITRASGQARHRLAETVRARQLSLLEALLVIVRRAPITVTERRLLGVALDLAVTGHTDREPTVPDVLRVLTTPPAALLDIAACETTTEFRRDTRDLLNTFGLVVEGPLRGIFDRPSSVHAGLDIPVMSLDLSALDDADDDVVAAAMLSSWAWAASVIDGTTAVDGRRRNVVRVQDELWRALRVAPGLVELSDRVDRLGRHRGEANFKSTHSFDDLEALASDTDRAKARGMAARCGVLVLGGMADAELDQITRVTPLTSGERALIRSWGAPPTWVPGSVHPGRGRYLLKSGERMGIPAAMTLTDTERGLYDTDRAFDHASQP